MEKALVFVYGTLRSGGRLHRPLADSTLIGQALTVKDYFMADGSFPSVYEESPDKLNVDPALCLPVLGQLWEVDRSTLAVLDMVEGHPRLFERKKVMVKLVDGGDPIETWMYFRCLYKEDLGLDFYLKPAESSQEVVYDWIS